MLADQTSFLIELRPCSEEYETPPVMPRLEKKSTPILGIQASRPGAWNTGLVERWMSEVRGQRGVGHEAFEPVAVAGHRGGLGEGIPDLRDQHAADAGEGCSFFPRR